MRYGGNGVDACVTLFLRATSEPVFYTARQMSNITRESRLSSSEDSRIGLPDVLCQKDAD